MRRWSLTVGILVMASEAAFASEMVHCDPADPLVSNRVISHETSANTQPAWLTDATYIINPSSTPAGSDRYWKCSGGSVVAMSASEQTALDAPLVAAQAQAAAFQTEVTSNDLCTAALTDLDSRIDAAVTAITDLASAKTFLRVALKKIARCVRARAGAG